MLTSPTKDFVTKCLKQLPESDLWRLFIDGFRQDEGQFAFDKGFLAEEGYYDSMIYAWKEMIAEIDTPLSAQYFAELHALSTRKLISKQKKNSNKMREAHDVAHGFSLLSNENQLDSFAWNCTLDGIREFIQSYRMNFKELKCNEQNYLFTISHVGKPSIILNVIKSNKSTEQIAKKIHNAAKLGIAEFLVKGDSFTGANIIINEYHQKISKAQNDNEKLIVIAACVGQLERLHAFSDANCRTMILTLNKLLLQNHLIPVIMENPNRIDFLSTAQLVEEIKKGQIEFKKNGINHLVEHLENMPLTKSNANDYIQQLTQGLSTDPLQALSQLNALFKQLSANMISLPVPKDKQKPHLFSTASINLGSSPSEYRMLKDLLQAAYIHKFNETEIKLALLKKQNIDHQIKYSELHSKKDNLSPQERDEYEKSIKLSMRTPVAIEWIKQRMAEVAKEHKHIIKHIPKNKTQSDLKIMIRFSNSRNQAESTDGILKPNKKLKK